MSGRNGVCRFVKASRPTFWSKNDTAIAVMSSELRGALRSGTYAARSIVRPSTPVATMLPSSAAQNGQVPAVSAKASATKATAPAPSTHGSRGDARKKATRRITPKPKMAANASAAGQAYGVNVKRK